MLVNRLPSWQHAAALRDSWNELAHAVPFRQWEWSGTWWRHYGAGREWFALTVEDGGRVAGVAPWSLQQVAAFGRVIQFLGAGDACSDYLSVLCAAQDRQPVTTALAEWLVAASQRHDADRWDMLSLDGVAEDDPTIDLLLQELARHGCAIHRQKTASTWSVPLPGSWDQYLRQLSKPNRRHARVLQEKLIDTGRVSVRVATSAAEMEAAWGTFVELHQRRSHSLQRPGCFARPEFAQFTREVAAEFQQRGQLELLTIERDGTPLAAQFALLGGGVTHAYQVGINPDALADSPGWLVHTESIKRAIQLGHSSFDFLRGDEPHKQRMGAAARAMISVRVVPPRIGPKLLHTAWCTGTAVKSWLKSHLEASGIL